MRVSVSSPRGYLNWDKFLSSNFVMLAMYGLQLTTTKFLIFVYLDHPFILNTNWSNPLYHTCLLHDKGNHQLPTWDYLLNNIRTISMCMLRFSINIQLQCIKRSDHKRKQNFSWPRTNHNNRPKRTSIANCSRKKVDHPNHSLIPEWLCVITIFFKTRINSCQ